MNQLTVTAGNHSRDEDCIIGVDGCCMTCGVSHTTVCEECGGRGFHQEGCAESDEIPLMHLSRAAALRSEAASVREAAAGASSLGRAHYLDTAATLERLAVIRERLAGVRS